LATDIEQFVERSGRDDAIKEVRRQIEAEGVTYMYYQFVSVTGRIMGKGIPAKHWETIAHKGFQLVYGSTANLFVDRLGNAVPGSRRGGRRRCVPDVGLPRQPPADPRRVHRGDRAAPAGRHRAGDDVAEDQPRRHAVGGR
jgi:glutamine synthetase